MDKIRTVDDFLDEGYMAEDFEASDCKGDKVTVTRRGDGAGMQLFISIPSLQPPYEKEIKAFDRLLQDLQVDMTCYVIVSKKTGRQSCEMAQSLHKMRLLIDDEGEFGGLYGTQIVSESHKDLLYKTLFLISKDGAVFYVDMVQTLQEPFDTQRLRVEANKAYNTYNGTGCHG